MGESERVLYSFFREIYTPYYENKGKDGINYVRIFVGGDGTRSGYCSIDLTYINLIKGWSLTTALSFLFIRVKYTLYYGRR